MGLTNERDELAAMIPLEPGQKIRMSEYAKAHSGMSNAAQVRAGLNLLHGYTEPDTSPSETQEA